jgi:asparagine synthetase B (glutamine-hydrolysing)
MLLVTVQSCSVPTGLASESYNDSVSNFYCGDLRVSIRTGPLFGFRHKIGDLIVAGESCFPFKEGDTRSLEDGIRDGVPYEVLLGDRILVLVVIDPLKRVVTIAQSLASWRPCYFSVTSGSFTFSTSVRGLREAGHEVAWDPTCTPEYLMYRFVAPPRSMLRGVRKLAGGQLLVVDLQEWRVCEDRRWRWPDGRGDDPKEEIINVLRARIEEWLQSFPSAGILLSGGLDSSLLAAIARVAYPEVPTFSTNFSFANLDDGEAQYALSMARHLGVTHQVHNTTPERYLTGWVESIHAAEHPVHHLQSVLLHILFQDRAAAGHGAILCGDGGDNVFGNASHELLYRYRSPIAFLRTMRVSSIVAPLADALGWHGRWGTLLTRRYDRQLSSVHHFLWLLGRYGDRTIVQRICSCDDAALLGEHLGLLEAYRDKPLLDQVTALGLLFNVHGTITIWGKLAEASGVYLACPFTSPSVLAAGMRISWDVKLQEQKHLVRAALRELGVPETLIARRKLSFGFPARFWALKGALFQPIVDMATQVHGGEDVLASLQREEGGASMVLWCLLNQFLWTQLFEVGRSVEDLSGEILDRRRTAAKSR